MTNLCASPDVVKILEGKNDKFKYLFLCTSDEDVEIIKAASGALCMVMSVSPICLKKVFDVSSRSVLALLFFLHILCLNGVLFNFRPCEKFRYYSYGVGPSQLKIV